MLQNARVTAFTVSELLMETQQWGLWECKIPRPPHTLPSRLGLKILKKIGQEQKNLIPAFT